MRRLFALAVVVVSASQCLAAAKEQKPATIADLIQQLSSSNFYVRQRAAKQLGNLGVAARDAVPALGKRLHDVYPAVRGSAAKALGQIGTPSVGVLVEALKARDAGVRTRAAQALGQAGPDVKEAVPALIAALKDKHVDVRVAAVDALGEMGAEGKEAAPQLARLFHDGSGSVREHVRVALVAIGPAAIEPLSDALGEEDVETRLDAIKTLMLFGSQAKRAVPALRHAMKDEDHRIRAAAAEALGKMELDAADAVPELLDALKDKNRQVHKKAANALVLLTMAGVPDLLEKVRKAENKHAWLAPALQVNLAIKAANPLTPLLKDLKDKDPQVRSKAALTLGSLGPQAQPAVRALTKILSDDNVQVRLSAAMAIARIERSKVEVNLAVKRVLRAIQDQLDDMKALQAIANAAAGLAQENALSAMTRPTPAQVEQFVMTYIVFKVTVRGQGEPMFVALNRSFELYLSLLQEEAVPALVAGINFVARFELGDC
ncbi:MAG: HEAT repeat domain-containing protein [Gemmataceae bacterium]